ncbi:dihydrodipicolinate synthase family protein [Peptoniphilus sp. MSJ-1]|uniref:Dihydrodipicolinate synthase family protein n=1 Tax=Peptoniphilus ovalis TaxID=2841503 RepID=A0ABS6FDH2_9FIRM|nr:dihydrodipicolinate synthase family protein [Peptoniphilus ovalis]MBU5668229.1 dihydrodipicolinate synthase family protein [Peptoniphilus ovalis]
MRSNIITPTVTFLNEDKTINIEDNKKLINYLIDNGVDGLAPLGSSGEFPFISFEEKKKLIDLYVKENNKRIKLIAGTSSMDFEETIELSNFAYDLGVDGVLVIPPYYFAMSQEEGFHYYDELAKNTKANIYIYNFEARSGFNISADNVVKLIKKHKNIKGLKDSTSDAEHTKEVIYKSHMINKDFEVYSGFDNHFLINAISGGSGCISAISNIIPSYWAKLVSAVNNKKFDDVTKKMREIDSLMKLYSVDSNFSLLFKKIINEKEFKCSTYTFFPFENIDEDKYKHGMSILNNLGLLK